MEAEAPPTPTGQSFCHRCGSSLGGQVDPRFCGACGAALAPPTPPPAAPYLRRMAGLAVDWVVVGTPMVAAFMWLESLGGADAEEAAAYIVGNLLIYGTPFLYWALVPRLWSGHTIGRRVFRIRVVRAADGSEVTYLRALGRAFIVVLLATVLIPVIVDLLFPLFGRHQSIADRATETVVTPDPA